MCDPVVRISEDGKRRLIIDPYRGICLSYELRPRVCWMVLLALVRIDNRELSKPRFLELSLS